LPTLPKSSLSKAVSGKAAQLTATKGPPDRSLFWWMARATNSFPVPVSPMMRTGVEVRATRCTSAASSRLAALLPTKASPAGSGRRMSSTAFSRQARTCAILKGFVT